MVGIVGLVTDLGYARFVKWKAQTAADAAALAAIEATMSAFGETGTIACGTNAVCQSATPCPYPVPMPPSNNLDNGCLYAQENGFITGGNLGRQSVTMQSGITSPPPFAAGVSASYWVRVEATENIPQFFSAVFGNSMGQVSSQATAAIVGNPANPCVYVMDPSANNAFSISGSASVTVSCGIQVNSSSLQAMVASGSARVSAAAVEVHGNFITSGSATISPPPVIGADPVTDPFAGVAAPTASVCDFTDWSVNGGGTAALNPGVYCNGIKVTGSSTATFNPGVYVLRGGGLQVSGGSNLSGNGVTFYNTGGGAYSYQAISITGGGHLTLSAPTSGPYAGLLFFQDRSIVSSATNSISGGSIGQFTGVLYFPTTPLSYSGGSGTNWTYTTILAKTVTFSGNAYFHNYAVLLGGLSSRFAGIVG